MEIFTIDLQFMGREKVVASYLIATDRKIALIETGPRATLDTLIEKVKEIGYRPKEIDIVVVTHIHLDHAGAAGDVLKMMDDAYLYLHPRGYPHLHDPSKLWKSSREVLGDLAEKYGSPTPIPTKRMVKVDDGSHLDLGEDSLLFVYTPGHASHHITPFLIENRVLFTGDAAGLYYLNRIMPNTPPPHNYELAISSLKKLLSLNPERVLFTHFGEYRPGRDAVKKAIEKWMRWADILREAYTRSMDIISAYRYLLERDEDARLFDEYFKARGFGREEVLVNVKGLMGYFSWKEAR